MQLHLGQPVLLSFSIALTHLATLAMEHDAGKLVATLAAVDLDQDASAIGIVLEKAEQVEGLDESAQLLQRTGWQTYFTTSDSRSAPMRRDRRDAIPLRLLIILFRSAVEKFFGGRLTATPAIGLLRESSTDAP